MPRDYARNNKRSSSRGRRAEPEDSGGHNWRWPIAGILIALFAAGIFYLKLQSDKIAGEQGDSSGSIIQQTMKQNNPDAATFPTSAASAKKSTAVNQPKAAAQTSPPPQPKFDFYTMLPKGQSAAATSASTTPVATPAPAMAASSTLSQPAATNNPAPVTTTPAATPADNAATPETKKPISQKQLEKNAQQDTSDLIAAEIQKLGTDKNTTKTAINAAKSPPHYIVQLGTFKNYNDADQLKAQLVLQGFAVVIKNYKKENTTLYRVLMGPYPSMTAAKKQQQLLAGNQIKSRIVKN